MRVPNQSAPIDLYKNFFLPKGPCEGEEYEGPADLYRLVHRTLESPAFCSPRWSPLCFRGLGPRGR